MAKGLTANLEAAMAALEQRPSNALQHLVKAWVERPLPALAGLVERFEQAHPPPSFEGKTKEFLAAAKKPNAVQLGTLARALVAPKAGETIERLEALRPWCRDPRVSSALLRLLQDVPWTSDGARDVWRVVFSLATKIADPRLVDAAKTLPASWGFRAAQREWLGARLEAASAEVEASLKKSPVQPLTAAEARLVDSLMKSLVPRVTPKPEQARSKEALLAEIFAHPDDDAPRLVYADWCLERDDPHGEFITLQFKADKTAAELKREAALQKKHGKTWLGALESVTLKDVEFRRGFPAKVIAKFKGQREAKQYGDAPEWAAVEDLCWSTPGAWTAELLPWQEYFPKHARPRTLSVRVTGLTRLLDASHPWPIEHLTVDVSDIELLKRFAASTLFPKVRVLRVKSLPYEVTWLTRGWLAKVEDLGGVTHQTELAPWLVALAELPRFVFEHSNGATLTFTRGADGRLSKLHVATSREREDSVAFIVKALPAGLLLEVTTEGVTAATAHELAALAGRTADPTQPAAEATLPKPLAAIADADGWRILTASSFERRDATGQTVTHREAVNTNQTGAFSADGRAVVGGFGPRLEWRDGMNGTFVKKEACGGRLFRAQWTPDSKHALFHFEDRLEVRDGRTLEVQRTIKSGQYPKKPVCAALSPDGAWLVACQQTGDVHLWAPGAAKPRVLALKEGKESKNYLASVAFIDPHHFMVSMRVGGLQVFDVSSPETPTQVVELPEALSMIVSPSSNAAALGDSSPFVDGQLTVLRLPSMKQVLHRTGACQALAFSSDGDRLLVMNEEHLEVLDVR